VKIAILSRGSRLYSTGRLREAAEMRGHQARVLDTLDFSIEVEQGNPRLYDWNKELSDYDAVIPRVGAGGAPLARARRGLSPKLPGRPNRGHREHPQLSSGGVSRSPPRLLTHAGSGGIVATGEDPGFSGAFE
jgi:hypothetical protein